MTDMLIASLIIGVYVSVFIVHIALLVEDTRTSV
jgi:hypothetical protein